jgi:benzoyl-CoA reductase subunit D
MITVGIDCGAKNTKTIIMRDGNIVGRATIPTGFDQEKAVEASLAAAVKAAGINREDITCIYGTGSGKNAVKMADDTVDDIKAMSKGAHFYFPAARTVADVGAEEGRAARVDEKGNPIDFVINEECAAGAGAFIDAMARALEVTIEEMGPLSLQSDREIPINAQCAIFAESEVVGLIHSKTHKPDISRAIHHAMASHIVSMIRRLGVNQDIAMIGGVGNNPGILDAIKRELKIEKIYVSQEPEYGAAVGAAAVAAEDAKRY